jgi:phosphohistidine phosphatase
MLLLMRHAEAVEFAPGTGDVDRPLSENGRGQASRAAAYLEEKGFEPDKVLCSSARRTTETAELLELGGSIECIEQMYNAGSDTIREEIEALSENVRTVLVVAHAPGIPTLAHHLTDLAVSDLDAVRAIQWGFPPATLVGLEIDGSWSELRPGRLHFAVHF